MDINSSHQKRQTQISSHVRFQWLHFQFSSKKTTLIKALLNYFLLYPLQCPRHSVSLFKKYEARAGGIHMFHVLEGLKCLHVLLLTDVMEVFAIQDFILD